MCAACARLNRHLPHPDDGCGDLQEAEEVSGVSVEAGCDAAEVIELIAASLDDVSDLVGL